VTSSWFFSSTLTCSYLPSYLQVCCIKAVGPKRKENISWYWRQRSQ